MSSAPPPFTPNLPSVQRLLQTLITPTSSPFPIPNQQQAEWAQWLISHELGPLAYRRYRQGNLAFARYLKPDFALATAQNNALLGWLEQVLALLAAAQIQVVVLKGASLITTVYEEPALRTMTDVDLWIQPQKLEQAISILSKLGFRHQLKETRPIPLQILAGGEVKMAHSQWKWGLIELHLSPLGGWWLKRTAKMEDANLWARAEPITIANQPTYRLAVEDAIIHNAVHLAINHQFGKTPLRDLIDLQLLSQERMVNWQQLGQRAKAWQVDLPVWLTLQLAHRLFHWQAVEGVLTQLRPGTGWLWLLQQLVSPNHLIQGADLRSSRVRYLLLLSLVSHWRDMGRLLFRSFIPEPDWLLGRYGSRVSYWHHFWNVVRYGGVP